jgi:hypothetical protein
MVSRPSRFSMSMFDDAPPWVLVARLFFGLGWIRAATEKLIDPYWWNGTTIERFLTEHVDSTLAWYRPFTEHVVAPQLDFVVVLVVALQLVAGVSLLTGRALGLGLAIGIVLNLNFVAAGAVNPSAFYLIAQISLALWLVEQHPEPAGRRALLGGTLIVVVLGVLSAPLIGTLHPAEVIDDPAVMFLTFALLATVGTVAAIRRHQRASGRRSGQRRHQLVRHPAHATPAVVVGDRSQHVETAAR